MTILSVGETNFGFLKIGQCVNPVVSMNGTGGDVLLLGQSLGEESPRPKAHLTIVVAEWDRSLRRIVERLDMHRGLVWSGSGRHGSESRGINGSLPSDLRQRGG